MEKQKPVYVKGSAREVVFEDGGSLINFSLNKDQIAALPDKDGYVQLTLKQVKDGPDRYGNTHYMVLNEFRPTTKATENVKVVKDDKDDLPF